MYKLIPRVQRIGDIEGAFNFLNHKPLSILDWGCGDGQITNYFNRRKNNIIGIEIDYKKILIAKENYILGNYILFDGLHLPFKNNSYDTMILNDVLEHINPKFYNIIFSEIKRVLHKKGVLYISVSNKYQLNEPHVHIPFLTWLPDFVWKFIYKKIRNKEYEMVFPQTKKNLEFLLKNYNLEVFDLTNLYVERKINNLCYIGDKKIRLLLKILLKFGIDKKVLTRTGEKVSEIVFVCKNQ